MNIPQVAHYHRTCTLEMVLYQELRKQMNSDVLSVLSTYVDEETLNSILVADLASQISSNQDFWYRRATQIVRDNLKRDDLQLELRLGSDWKAASGALEAAFETVMPFTYHSLEITSALVLYELGYGRSRDERDVALLNACHNGHLELVGFLLELGADPDSLPCLLEAVATNRTEVALLLLSIEDACVQDEVLIDKTKETLGYTILHHAVRRVNLTLVEAIVSDEDSDWLFHKQDAYGDEPLQLAMDLFVFRAQEELSGTSQEDPALLSAEVDALEAIVLLLIEQWYPDKDAGYEMQVAFQVAGNYPTNYKDTMEFILQIANHSAAISDAIIGMYYSDESPFSRTDELEELSELGYHFSVRAILEQCRCDPQRGNSKSLRVACENGHAQTVQFLLEDGRADPMADEGICLEEAAARGHVGVVSVLLADRRVNPRANHNAALRAAQEGGHTEVVRLLERATSRAGQKKRRSKRK